MLFVSNLSEALLYSVPLKAEEDVIILVLDIALSISLEIPLLNRLSVFRHVNIISRGRNVLNINLSKLALEAQS